MAQVRARVNGRVAEVTATALGIAVAIALGLWSSHQDPGASALLVLAIGIVVALPIGVRLVQGRFDPFEPTVIFAIAYGAMFVARPAVMIADHDYALAQVSSIDLQPAFDRMLILALLGAVCFVVGYAMPFGKQWAELAPRPPREFDRETAAVVAFVAAGVGVLSFLLFVAQSGGLGALSTVLGGRSYALTTLTSESPKYLDYGSLMLVGPAVLLFSLYRQRQTGAMLALTVVAFAAAAIVRGSSGSRYALLPLFGGMLVFWFVSRGRRPRLLTSVVLIAVALVVSAGIVYGRNAKAETSPTAGADYKAGLAKAVSSPGAPLEPIIKSGDAAMAPWLTAAMTVIPQQMGYGYGRYMAIDLFTRWIPRQLWSGKPQPPHTQVTDQIAPVPGTVQYIHPAYSVLMHAYLDFGMFGALWLLGYGVMLRALFEWFLIHSRSVPAMLIFSLGVVLTVPALRDNPVDTLILIGVLFLPIALAYRLAQRHIGARSSA